MAGRTLINANASLFRTGSARVQRANAAQGDPSTHWLVRGLPRHDLVSRRAQAIGSLGGKSRMTKLRLARMPRDDAERIWRDPAIAMDRQASALCGRGW